MRRKWAQLLPVILCLDICLVRAQRNGWRHAKKTKSPSTESMRPQSFHGKNDYRWEISGNFFRNLIYTPTQFMLKSIQ